jgi:hypothetical protein
MPAKRSGKHVVSPPFESFHKEILAIIFIQASGNSSTAARW